MSIARTTLSGEHVCWSRAADEGHDCVDLEKGKKTYGIGVGNHKAWIDDESVKGIPYKNTERVSCAPG